MCIGAYQRSHYCDVKRPLIVQWVVGSIPYGGPIELVLVPANAPMTGVTDRGVCYPVCILKINIAANRNK